MLPRRRCLDITFGCTCAYIATDLNRWHSYEKRQARQQQIREELRHRRRDLLEQFHDFKRALQKEGAIQAATDTGKLALGVLPGGAILGQSLDALNDASNFHDLYLLMCEVKDICDLEGDEETAVLKALARNDDGECVIKSLLMIERLDSEVRALESHAWAGHGELLWWMPWRPIRQTYQQYMLSGIEEESDPVYAQIFKVMDKDGDGIINKTEFERALKILDGPWKELAKAYAHIFFKRADIDDDGEVSLEDFTAWVHTTQELVDCFNAIDTNNDGFINEAEFEEVLRKASQTVPSLNSVDADFKSIDNDSDGHINMPEFVGWMQGSSEIGFRAACRRMMDTAKNHAVRKSASTSSAVEDLRQRLSLPSILEGKLQNSNKIPSLEDLKDSLCLPYSSADIQHKLKSSWVYEKIKSYSN